MLVFEEKKKCQVSQSLVLSVKQCTPGSPPGFGNPANLMHSNHSTVGYPEQKFSGVFVKKQKKWQFGNSEAQGAMGGTATVSAIPPKGKDLDN